MNSTTKALTLSFLERYTALILGIGSTMVLARILTPGETGLFSIGVALTTLIAQFRDFGVATFLIQEPDLTDEKFRTALGVSTITMFLRPSCWAAAGPAISIMSRASPRSCGSALSASW